MVDATGLDTSTGSSAAAVHVRVRRLFSLRGGRPLTLGDEPSFYCTFLRFSSQIRGSTALHIKFQASQQLWYKKPPAGLYAYHRFHLIGSRCGMEQLDIGGSMGTVPRQESVPNGSMHHRELLNGTVDLPHLPARALILKNMKRPSRTFF